MEVQQIGGALGAVVSGIKLAAMADSEVAAVRAALAEHQVLIFRDQPLSEAEQLEVTARFGSVYDDPALRDPVTKIENSAEKPPSTDGWHADTTFVANPPSIGILRGVVVPPWGGDTMWVSLRAIYRDLAEPLKELAHRLSARHELSANYRKAAQDTVGHGDQTDYEHVHPLAISVPHTDELSLFLSPAYLTRIEDVAPHESAGLLALFNGMLDRPLHQFRWRWSPDDVAMWDERSVNHRGVADHFVRGPQYRLMHQSLVIADPVQPAPAYGP